MRHERTWRLKRRRLHNILAKEWPHFSIHPKSTKEDQNAIDTKRDVDGVGDDLRIFLQDSEDCILSNAVEEIGEFCQGAEPDYPNPRAPQRRAAWLDDRSFQHRGNSGCARRYNNPLTANELHEHLREPRSNKNGMPDADRRLIYISDLDSHYILVLAKTAPARQNSALREAIWNHFTLGPLIRVKIPPRGFQMFQLEYHLPYCALRKDPLSAEASAQGAGSGKMLERKSIDVSYLNVSAPKSKDKTKWIMYESQSSLVITGSNEMQWTGYALSDHYFDAENPLDEVFSYSGIQEDPIAWSTELDGLMVDANNPVWNPRVYFLIMLEIRIAQVVQEWTYLIRNVEVYVTKHEFESITNSSVENAKEDLERIEKISPLLRKFLDVISGSIKAWDGFVSPNGDHGYFADMYSSSRPYSPQSDACKSFKSIRSSFETLERRRQTLLDLVKSCKQTARNLKLRLARESSEAIHYSGVTGEFTILIISPLMLAGAIFSTQQPVVPLKANFRSFIITAFVSMVIIKLLHVFLGAFSRRSWCWKKIAVWMYKIRTSRPPSASSWYMRKRGRNSPDKAVVGIEVKEMADMAETV